jgi:nicotinamidase/pyrazinamidase
LSSHAPGLAALLSSGPSYSVSETVFNKYDKDGNGHLQLSEMKEFFTEAFPGHNSEAKMQAMMQAIDLDGDSTVGLNEMRAFLQCYDPNKHTIKMKTALVIIDVQNDFITGTLANPYGAQSIIPLINKIRDLFDVVVISSDWHPNEHCSFVESVNAGKVAIVEDEQDKQGSSWSPFATEQRNLAAFTMVTLKGDKDCAEHQQMLYPRHAVQDSQGAACHKDLVLKDSDDQIYNGTKANIDSYSAFFDNCKANDTGLTAILDAKGVTDVLRLPIMGPFTAKVLIHRCQNFLIRILKTSANQCGKSS